MSWLFSQALVEEYLGDISSDGEQSVQSSGNPIQLAYLSLDKMTVFSRLSRFGMTYKPLTADRGEELLMSYLAGFPVRTLAQQEREQGLTESEAECGEKWHGSFVKYDPDSSSWKTHQCSLLGDLDEFSETWPRWGLMRSGECWEQPMLVARTNETEFGLLDGETFFHTPNCTVLDGWSNNQKVLKKRLMFPTPVKSESNGSAAFKLTDAVEASIGKAMPKMQKNPHKWEQFRTWTTPVSDDTGHRKNKYAQGGTALSTQVGGKLNPMWVEWLMGWPLGWTDLKPLEMDKYQKWLDEHGSC